MLVYGPVYFHEYRCWSYLYIILSVIVEDTT
jgi:hypothetical protein